MIDERVYSETFSRLRASQQAKEEVFQMMETRKHNRRLPKVLRGAAIAAVMVMALAVTAGAVNVATDGELFREFLITWVEDDNLVAVDDQGNQVYITIDQSGEDLVTKENGRLILHADQDIDITDELVEKGSYHYEYEAKAVWEDGSQEVRTITIDVTGDLDSWTVTRSNGGDVSDTVTSGESEGGLDVTLGARPAEVVPGEAGN